MSNFTIFSNARSISATSLPRTTVWLSPLDTSRPAVRPGFSPPRLCAQRLIFSASGSGSRRAEIHPSPSARRSVDMWPGTLAPKGAGPASPACASDRSRTNVQPGSLDGAGHLSCKTCLETTRCCRGGTPNQRLYARWKPLWSRKPSR